jgi:hypothetical protein
MAGVPRASQVHAGVVARRPAVRHRSAAAPSRAGEAEGAGLGLRPGLEARGRRHHPLHTRQGVRALGGVQVGKDGRRGDAAHGGQPRRQAPSRAEAGHGRVLPAGGGGQRPVVHRGRAFRQAHPPARGLPQQDRQRLRRRRRLLQAAHGGGGPRPGHMLPGGVLRPRHAPRDQGHPAHVPPQGLLRRRGHTRARHQDRRGGDRREHHPRPLAGQGPRVQRRHHPDAPVAEVLRRRGLQGRGEDGAEAALDRALLPPGGHQRCAQVPGA